MPDRMKEKKIIDFLDASERGKWERINDTVMGGSSESSLTPADNMAVFEGVVSFENFGGFASVRSLPREFALEGYEGLVVRVRGDGRRYRLRLKTDDEFEGVSYQAVFFTDASEWTEARLSFEEFVPVFRGAIVSDAPPLDPARINRVGFMIADRQKGPFRLEIKEVCAYKENEQSNK